MNGVRKAIASRDDFFLLRVVAGSVTSALAVLSVATSGIDNTFLLLAGIAAVFFAFPWQRLSALRAGPFEFSLERGQIKGAIDSIDVRGTEKERIEGVLSRLAADVERARGSRVLWVDDRPRRVVGERRLFRALEIESVVVSSCADAARLLMRDNDFDLLITSLEKHGESRKMKGDPRNPGVAFVRWLRGKGDEGIQGLIGGDCEVPVEDAVINRLAVIFYAAFPLSYIQEKVQPLAGLEPTVEAAQSLDDLLRKAIRRLADVRSDPIEVSSDKRVFAS